MKTNNRKVLIVGAGFVGGTAYRAFSLVDGWTVQVYDKNPTESLLQREFDEDVEATANDPFTLVQYESIHWASSIKDASDAGLVFVAVPTPMNEETGECYTGIVESVIKEVRSVNQESWICVKSTVPPGTTQKLNDIYKRVCFNPEFLTEKHAWSDFINLEYQIIGYPELMPGIWDSLECPLEDLFHDCYEQGILACSATLDMSSTQAEMVKYTRNSYLATRLSFFNEIKQICDQLDVDYRQMKYFAGLDKRVGNHYNEVRETDPGWGLSCLPKDLNALKFLAKSKGVNPLMLEAAWQKNLEVRKDKDWEKMEKAIFKEKNDGF